MKDLQKVQFFSPQVVVQASHPDQVQDVTGQLNPLTPRSD